MTTGELVLILVSIAANGGAIVLFRELRSDVKGMRALVESKFEELDRRVTVIEEWKEKHFTKGVTA